MSAPIETRQIEIHSTPYICTTEREYYKLLCDIRNMRELTDAQRETLHHLSTSQLLQIIEIYNLVVQNINYLFS
jgi:hypothetical protein